MGYFCKKNTFLQLKHYVQRISTTCVKIRQMTYFIFETISHFSRDNSSVIFLAHMLHTFYHNSPSKCIFSNCALLVLIFTKFLMSFFKQNASFASKFGSFFSVMRDHSSVLFRLKLYVLVAKVVHQRANFQTCHCSH